MTKFSLEINFGMFRNIVTQFGTDLLIPVDYSVPKIVVSGGPLRVFDLTSEVFG